MKVHVFVIAWPGVQEQAKCIAAQVQGHADSLTVIYSSADGSEWSGAGDWRQVSNEWFFGWKFQQALQWFRGDVLLVLHADAHHPNWAEVVSRCRQRFETIEALGVWAPECDNTFWPLDQVAIARWKESECFMVSQTDCIVCAFSAKVVHRLNQLKLDDNNLGWGIDWAAIAYAYSHHQLVLMDTSLKIAHALGTGYAKDQALQQMTSFLRQLTPQEQVVLQLLQEHDGRRAPQSVPAMTRPVVESSPHPSLAASQGHALEQARRQIRQLQQGDNSPWSRRPAPGFMRGIDAYKPDALEKVLAHAMSKFRQAHGDWPNLSSPEQYAEKIFWTKFLGEMKVPESGNKLATASFIPSALKEQVLCPEVVWHSTAPVLPDNETIQAGVYYLKASHGCGMFKRIRYPLAAQDKASLEKLAAGWLSERYGLEDGEWWYNVFTPQVFLEKSVAQDKDTISWNVPVINGHTPILGLYLKSTCGEDASAWFDTELRRLPQTGNHPPIDMPHLPEVTPKLFSLARQIAGGLPFVRVDFLLGDDQRVYLCEMTFSPGNALTKFNPDMARVLNEPWKILR